jgi:glycosyltransferase involved in cell wall biosynthesis
MYEVTIAIPVYNVEPYIKKSLESALSQSFKSIEFLIIDDKGNDGSMDIVRKLQKEHTRGHDIKIVDNLINKGISETRNIALHEASGKYFFFLDSDDYISKDCIEILYNTITREQVELVISSYQILSLDGELKKIVEMPYMIEHKTYELAKLRFGILHNLLLGYTWNILYDLSFLRGNNLHFKNFRVSSDTVFSLDLIPIVSSFALIPNITYYYVNRPNSLTVFNNRTYISHNEVRDQINLRIYCKGLLNESLNRSYFGDMALYAMHYSYNGLFAIMKHRKLIKPPLLNADIRDLLSFPLSWKNIMQFKKHKTEFLLYYLMNSFPICISRPLAIVMSRLYIRKQK